MGATLRRIKAVGNGTAGTRLAQNGATDTDLSLVAKALAGLNDCELRPLIDATNGAPQIAPGLLAWLEAACDWELNRRCGLDYALQLPEAAIPPEEDVVSISAAVPVRATFAHDARPEAEVVLALLDAVYGLLTGGAARH